MFNQVFNFNKNRSLRSGLPQMGTTLNGWEVPLELVKIKQSIVNGDAVKTEEHIKFLGVWQPFSDDRLQALPEGQRSWSWFQIHAKAGTLNLQTGDKVVFQKQRYKVMAVRDYTQYAYIEYHVILDYQNNA